MATKKHSKSNTEVTETAKATKSAKPPTSSVPAKRAKADGTKKTSAMDAAAKVLEQTGQAMTCHELIEAMAAKGLWSSPSGKTPANTLSAAIRREIRTKVKDTRFTLAERGKFARA